MLPSTPKSNDNLKWFILIGLVALGICVIPAFIAMFNGLSHTFVVDLPESMKVQSTLEKFIQLAAAQDVDGAYTLFANVADVQMHKSAVTDLITKPPYLFANYKAITKYSFTTNTTEGLESSRTNARISGNFACTGQFTANLIKIGSNWQFSSIHITVDPAKFKAWQATQPK